MATFPLAVKVELYLNSVWTDITSYVMSRDQPTQVIQITRGRRNESTTSDPALCVMQLNNRDGRFTPRNPVGAYYGTIGRNTQLRVSVPTSAYLTLAAASDTVTTPDSVPLSITGDLQVVVDAYSRNWTSSYNLVGKYTTTANQRSWWLGINAGYLRLITSVAGTADTVTATSTVPIPAAWTGRRAFKATMQVNNGAGGNTVTFYTADYAGGTWTQLGAAVVTAGTTSIFDSTAPLTVGGTTTMPIVSGAGPERVFSVEVRSGIAGTIVASPDFTAQTALAATFADAQANTWTVNATSSLAVDYRFWGEVSEWPQAWDQSLVDRWVTVTATGILRRIGARKKEVRSAYYRGCTSKVAPVTNLTGYWSMEDAVGSTSMASGMTGGRAMTWTGTPVLASDSTSFPCSAPIPVVGTGVFTGVIPGGSSGVTNQVRVLIAVPAAGTTNNSVLLRVNTTGTATRWDVVYTTGGNLTLNAYDSTGTLLATSGAVAFNVDGTSIRLNVAMMYILGVQYWEMSTLNPGSTTGGTTGATVIAGQTVTGITGIVLNTTGNANACTMGHATVQNYYTSIFDLDAMLDAHNTEQSGARLQRLCAEESITLRYVGNPYDTAVMGRQTQMTVLDLLHECETADQGVLFEDREAFGLAYRSRRSLSAQPSSLDLSFTGADLSAFTPIDDDQLTVNDVTTTRKNGSSARVTLTSGALSTLDPPNGVGVYDAGVTVNLAADNQCWPDASWRLALGTVDESRYPSALVQTARSNFTTSHALTSRVRRFDVGDRLVVSSFPTGLPPDPADQLGFGLTETLGQYALDVSAFCVPSSPYRSGVYGVAVDRYDGGFSTLNGAHNSSTTSLSVATSAGGLWTHGDGDFDILVGGERMTVTAVAGAASPQTFTVVRSVNGVVKAHSTAAPVRLFTPVKYGL